MARITTSANAPSELVTYGFASGSFKLAGGEVYETDDKALIASARIHPWLKVEYDKVDLISGVVRDTLANHPNKDVMSSEHKDSDVPFDPEAIAKIEEEKAAADDTGLAIDANLKQDTSKTVGFGDDKIAITLAADEDHVPQTDTSKSDGVDPDAAEEPVDEDVAPAEESDEVIVEPSPEPGFEDQPAERDVAEPGPGDVTDPSTDEDNS